MSHEPPRIIAAIPAAHEQFCVARQVMLRDLNSWLASHPSADDVAEELDGTISALRSLVSLGAPPNA